MVIAKEARPPAVAVGCPPGWRVKKSAATAEQRELRSHLHMVRWGRLVLFDAHVAANPTTQRAKAVMALGADVRWAVSGPGDARTTMHAPALLGLVTGESASRASAWRAPPYGGLVRERRGEVATLLARGCDLGVDP